jgi:hypothetical protein
MELNIEEQTLIATYRTLDDLGKKELLRFASQQRKLEAAASAAGLLHQSGQCKLERCEERPETAAEPIFTE